MYTVLACDIETTGLDWTQESVIGLGAVDDQGNEYWITDPNYAVEVLSRYDILVWHNGKFDLKVIKRWTGEWVRNTFDTYLAAMLLPPIDGGLGLEALSSHYLGAADWKDKKFIKNLSKQPIEEVRKYCLTDCRNTLGLYKIFRSELTKKTTDFLRLYLMPASDMLTRAEYRGVKVNERLLSLELSDKLREISRFTSYLDSFGFNGEYTAMKVEEYKAKHPKTRLKTYELEQRSGIRFNWNSNDHKLWILRDKLGLYCTKTVKENGKNITKDSVDKSVLEMHIGAHPIVEALLDYSIINKQAISLKTYLDKVKEDGRIHTTYNLSGARTGRLSSSEPNLQNVPRRAE